MNNLITFLFSKLLSVLHILVLGPTAFLLYMLFTGQDVKIGHSTLQALLMIDQQTKWMLIAGLLVFLLCYVMVMGTITILISINDTLKEINRKTKLGTRD